MEENQKASSKAKGFAIFLLIAVIVVVSVIYILLSNVFTKEDKSNTYSSKITTQTEKESGESKEVGIENEYALTDDNHLSKFDLSFLKFENEKENKIYSPLSIKYAFKMLSEGATGKSKEQIDSIISAYNLTEYESNENMALANVFFIRDTYKENIKESYINSLKTKYDADVEFDDFSNAKKINLWVKNHTLNLLPDLLSDDDVNGLNFALINALGIDMEWKHKFLVQDYPDDENISFGVLYSHERLEGEEYGFEWNAESEVLKKVFDGNQEVSAMKVFASLNNYDVIKEIGEDNIYDIVYEDFKKWVEENKEYEIYTFNNDFSEENVKKVFDNWFENSEYPEYGYINSISENYGKVDYSTDFSIYVDDDVKVFAKDLKEYEGTTLQYIGIMPIHEDLDEYVDAVTSTDINDLIGNLKDLKRENFKDGYLTYIHGYIPKFSFEYELDLQKDLENLGITEVFEQGKANLTKMTDDDDAYIGAVKHKANIEFTQDGIKAAAATMAGGLGAGNWYDYYFEMPTEDIDITFDKPYMFLIRDKETGETWFVGTVYEPLDADEDTTVQYIMTAYEDRDNNNL